MKLVREDHHELSMPWKEDCEIFSFVFYDKSSNNMLNWNRTTGDVNVGILAYMQSDAATVSVWDFEGSLSEIRQSVINRNHTLKPHKLNKLEKYILSVYAFMKALYSSSLTKSAVNEGRYPCIWWLPRDGSCSWNPRNTAEHLWDLALTS